MMNRPGPPASIHDPISPAMAEYLPAFFWNVREQLTAQEMRRKAKADAKNIKDVERCRKQRAVAAEALSTNRIAKAAIDKARKVDPHERLIHKAPVRKGRMA
jgi:hypothetical protein